MLVVDLVKGKSSYHFRKIDKLGNQHSVAGYYISNSRKYAMKLLKMKKYTGTMNDLRFTMRIQYRRRSFFIEKCVNTWRPLLPRFFRLQATGIHVENGNASLAEKFEERPIVAADIQDQAPFVEGCSLDDVVDDVCEVILQGPRGARKVSVIDEHRFFGNGVTNLHEFAGITEKQLQGICGNALRSADRTEIIPPRLVPEVQNFLQIVRFTAAADRHLREWLQYLTLPEISTRPP